MNSLSNENFSKYHNNQMSSKPVSGINSPESYTFLPNRRITEESADYTERSRSEELEELQDIKQEAHKNYTNQKNMFDKFRRNPFSIESSKADIDPFKEIKEDRKNQLKASIEVDEIQQMYDEETILMNRISNLKDFRNIIQDYINLGIRLNDQISLDDESLDDFKDGLMEGVKVQSVTKNPKSKASCINNIKKALKVLKKKKSIPLYLIYAEQEIYEGNPELVFELLKSIKYAYKHVFKS